MDDFRLEVRSVPMLDTGIGQSMGFASDAELVAEVEAERAKLPTDVREALEAYDREFDRRVLGL